MSTLEQYKESQQAVTRLLLIGPSKSGKSDYVAQAAIDGFTIIYVDRDNGDATLLHRLKDNPEALRRVYYFRPKDLNQFVVDLFEMALVKYSERSEETFIGGKRVPDDDTITEIVPALIPRNVILSIDSLSAMAAASIAAKAKKMDIDLIDSDKYGREIYGSTGYVMTQYMTKLQGSSFHLILQAHPSVYERKEKPPGVAGDITEKMMIIKETTGVPLSTSGPHGATIPKYFNQVGWLDVDNAGNRKLDFRVRKDRLGGGTPNGIGDPRKEYSFAKLFGGGETAAPIDSEKPWIKIMTGAEFNQIQADKQANRPKLL